MRLAKFIAQCGHCSRRAASRLIDLNRVQVNGETAGHLTFVTEQDNVMIDQTLLSLNKTHYYVAYHKPEGVDCNVNVDDPSSVVNHIEQPDNIRLFPIGRLDKDSRGLLLLTNDGECCHRLLSPQYKRDKQYVVNVVPSYQRQLEQRACLDADFVCRLSGGVMLDNKMTLACTVELLGDACFKITLKQGLNRQIRRMTKSQGFFVVDLKRLSFADVVLGDLAPGQQRELNKDEIMQLTGVATKI